VKDLLDARDLCNLFSTVIEQIDKTRGEIYKGWAPQISFDRGLRDLVEWAGHSGTLSG
jgi:nucleoside-diphosphate-sugar epimerase